jgi:predicted RNA-binding Zn-ribbon protein involved in translation (DUF1610 family)|tara:strand:+ start:3734 stop:3910 length:177 start_codon:yes stop_codon:yes gene_type:complete
MSNENIASVTNSTEVIEKQVTSWRNKDKHPCPKCGKKLGMPEYKCDPCNVKLKLKMQF